MTKDDQKGVMMMGKRKLVRCIVLGAVVGGITALTDRKVRSYTKATFNCAKDKVNFYQENPTIAISKLRLTVNELNHSISTGTDQALNLLDQAEDKLNKQIEKSVPIQK